MQNVHCRSDLFKVLKSNVQLLYDTTKNEHGTVENTLHENADPPPALTTNYQL